ncbi:MAG: LCP family protein [Clostridia bacterium]|nr:LCP family protein [Clostridia bacterium]
MKRARKGNFSRSTVSKRRQIDNKSDRNIINDLDDNKYKINEDEKKDFQLKYYGKVMENDAVEDTGEILSAQGNNSENPEEAQTNNTVSEEEVTPTGEEENTQEVIDNTNIEEEINSSDISDESIPLEENNPKAKRKKLEGKKKFALIFSISLVVFICFSFLAFGLSGFFDKSPLDNSDETYTEPVDEVTGKINVLILGVDNEGLRTDTIMVASYDTDDHKMNILSIPRDTRMYVGTKYQKINAAHAITKNGKIAGPQGSIEAVTRLTGIPINYYVEFSFSAFRETIDALGGVYYNVPQNMNYEDPVQDLYIHLTSGYQLLDGDKAEQLVRFRQYPQGDIKRVEVQQDFIKALAEQKMNASIVTKLPDLYKTVSKNVKTNFSVSDITKYAPTLLDLRMEDIVTYSLPGEYSGSEYSASYWLADMNELKNLIETTFGYDAEKITYKKPGEYLTFTAAENENSPSDTASEKASPSAKATSNTTTKPKQSAKATSKSTAKPTSGTKTSESPKTSSKPTQSTENTEKTDEPQKTEEVPSETNTTAPVQSAAPSFGTKPGTIIDASQGDTLKDVKDPSEYGNVARTPAPASPSNTPSNISETDSSGKSKRPKPNE